MSVYFAPPYRDVNAQNKQYMMMLAQMLGQRGAKAQKQGHLAAFAESLDPEPTSTINAQRLMSDQGFDALRSHVLEDTPATFGQVPGQPLNRMQMLQKALLHNIPPNEAVGMINAMQPQRISPTQQIAQKRLNRIDVLEAKVQAGTATKAEKKELERKIGPAPLVDFSGLDKLLTPGERIEKATAPLRKPLTST